MRTVSSARNRTLLIVIGVLLLVGGALLATVSFGLAAQIPWLSTWAPEPQETPGSLLGPVSQYVVPVSVALVVIVVLLALWWLLRQIPTKPRTTSYRISDDPELGTTTIAPSVIARVVEDHLQTLPGISGSQVDLAGTGGHPEILIRSTMGPRGNVNRVVEAIYGRVVQDAQNALQTEFAHVGVELDADRESASSRNSSTRAVDSIVK